MNSRRIIVSVKKGLFYGRSVFCLSYKMLNHLPVRPMVEFHHLIRLNTILNVTERYKLGEYNNYVVFFAKVRVWYSYQFEARHYIDCE